MRRLPFLLVLLFALAACEAPERPVLENTPTTRDGQGRPATGKVTVFAAASLTEAFERLAPAFEAANAGADVEFQFAGSQQLVAQLEQGAQADVLVTADEITMQRATDLGLLQGHPERIASNRLTIAVPTGNPNRIASLADLAKAGTKVVLAAPEVPAGRYARDALNSAGVKLTPVSEEPSVKAALTKVELGEADAGIVYVSDLKGRDRVTAVAIPPQHNVEARYVAARVADAQNRTGARAFVVFLRSTDAQQALEAAGFGPA